MFTNSPYRAPETIFGPHTYDPFAVDLWSLGALIAEFFTRLRFDVEDEEDDDVGGGSTVGNPDAPFTPYFIPQAFYAGARGSWSRDSLFDASRGSIGLAWSIFKIRGTPCEANWPVRMSRYQSPTKHSDHSVVVPRAPGCQQGHIRGRPAR